MKKFLTALFLFTALSLGLSAYAAGSGSFFTVTDAAYNGNDAQKYPVCSGGNTAAAKRINKFTEMVVPDFIQKERSAYKENIYVKSSYQITYNFHDYVSMVFTFEYGLEGWPQDHMRSYVFDSKTGRVLHAKDLRVSVKDIKNKLRIMADEKNIPLDGHAAIGSVPENFYYDKDFNLHFIFDKGRIAPEAHGIIDLNMDEY